MPVRPRRSGRANVVRPSPYVVATTEYRFSFCEMASGGLGRGRSGESYSVAAPGGFGILISARKAPPRMAPDGFLA